MKKIYILLGLSVFLLISCKAQVKTTLKSQKVVKNNIEMLYGQTSVEKLYFDYPDWRVEMETYKADSAIIHKLSKVNKKVDVLLFFSTWCSDCEREVPHFFHIMEHAGLNKNMNINMWAVDRKLRLDNDLSQKYQIKRVPTFIFIHNGKEIGRIVESPEAFLLEEDMYNILSAML